MTNIDTGILLNPQNIKLHRDWFKQMTKLLGLNVIYQPIKRDIKNPNVDKYNLYGELVCEYEDGIPIGCIYDEHPSQKTMRKLGWNAEMADNVTVIHVPYDLPGLQAGVRFTIPAGLDCAFSRTFKVLRMSNIAMYPASIACELGPVLETTLKQEEIKDFKQSNFNLLADESDEYGH